VFEKACLILILLALVGAAVASSHQPVASDIETTSVRVESGDSLWGIASSCKVEGLDTARTADLIAELNGLNNPALVAGTTIRVPASSQQASLAMR